MRRIAGAVLAWVVLAGGTWLYLNAQEARARDGAPLVQPVQLPPADYRVELTPTFAATPDPFALRLDEGSAPPALMARLNGVEVLRRDSELAAGETLRIEPLTPLLAGDNELFIDTSPPGEAALQAHALRVRVYRGASLVTEQTLWSEPGTALSGAVRFRAAEAKAGDRP
ncbi:MAG: hypothetical protein RLZZ303_2855 [Candidatus Hydrogenedentota bacterium]|jgi:hypothetical protein